MKSIKVLMLIVVMVTVALSVPVVPAPHALPVVAVV